MGWRKYNPADYEGTVFGRLTVLENDGPAITNAKKVTLMCRCSCGAIVFKSLQGLVDGHTKSCGCMIGSGMRRHGHGNNRKKGRAASPEYKAWGAAKQRCFNPKCLGFKNYGGRGITMCPEWRNSFDQFLADMGPRPDGFSLERIDVDGDYCRSNCKWIPRGMQIRNKQNTVKINFMGEQRTAREVARMLGCSNVTILYHKQKGDIYEWLDLQQKAS